MSFKEKAKENLQEEKKKMKDLSFKQKLQYIWDYYKLAMAGILGVLILIAIGVSIYKNSQVEHLLDIAMVNAVSFDGEIDSMMEDFREAQGADGIHKDITVDSSYQMFLEQNDEMTRNSNMKLIVVTQTDSVDMILMPKDVFQNYANLGMFKDVREVLGEETQKTCQDSYAYGKTEEDVEEIPYGIVLKDSPRLATVYGDTKEVYVGFANHLKNPQVAEEFLKYLLP